MFDLARKPRGRIVAVADIGSGSVAVGIAEISPPSHAHVLASSRAMLPSGERSSEATISGIVSLLEDTAEKVLKMYREKTKGTKHVDAACAVIHAPWVRSKTVRAETRLRDASRIEQEMIATLAREALRGETDFKKDAVLEAGIIRVELNGYPTLQPVGKYATHIAASALLSECEPRVREGIVETLTKVFACPPPSLRSDTRALLFVTRESSALPKEALIINMAHEATNVIIVRKGIVAETALVAEGVHTIVKRIAGDKMPEETLTLIRLLALDQCDTDACEAIRASIASAEPQLAKAFGETFIQLSATRRLPNKLVLLSHEDLAPWLLHFFSRLDFAQFTVTTRPFTPTTLSIDSIKELVSFENAPDISLGIASALVPLEIP
ncbi:hypothetical protein HY417_01735 [Candidatus Kaiserbacteria bacterium]|nr:hypothetical protein [Candidatus Kaiserbacteria bacterium]